MPRLSARSRLRARLACSHYPLSLTTGDVVSRRAPQRVHAPRIASPLSPLDEDSGDRTCLVRGARPPKLAGTAGVEPASFRLTGGRSAIELHAKSRRGSGTAPTSTQSTLLKSVSGHKKTPVGDEPAGVSYWIFPGRFDVRAFREQFLGRLMSSVPHYSWRAHQYGQTPYARVSRTSEHHRFRRYRQRIANTVWRRLINRVVW